MKKYRYFLIPSIILTIFVIWTILVKFVDVHYIEDVGSLGFYTFNTGLNEKIQSLNTTLFHAISNVLLFVSFATIIPFAAMGLVQLIIRKSFKKVDRVIYLILISYVLMVIMYVLFELIKINYSPLSVKDDLHASYPSSHAFIFITILGTNLFGLFYYVKMNKTAKICAFCAVIALFFLMLITRLLSGHHYFTDIVGALFLSISLLSIFDALTRLLLVEKD